MVIKSHRNTMGTWLKRSTSKKYVLPQDQQSMDRILESLVESQHPEQVKTTIIHKICEEGAQPTHPASTVRGVFQVCFKWIIHGTTNLLVSSGFQLLNQWGAHHLQQFQAFFTPQLVAQMLTPGYGNDANVPLLIREGFRVMNSTGPHLFHEHVEIVQNRVTGFICGSADRIVVRNVTLLLSEFSECMPSPEAEVNAFCMALIRHLSVGVPPQDRKEILRFINLTDEICSYLSLVWRLHSSDLLADCLAEIFRIISSSNTSEDISGAETDPHNSEPAISLAPVVKHIPIELANRVVKDFVQGTSISDMALNAAVGQMVEWLKWPTTQNVQLWISCFLKELAAVQKYSLLISITEVNMDKVFENISFSQLRTASFQVLSQLLLSFQHSPGPFHKVLEKIPDVLSTLRQENTAHSHKYLAKLSKLIHCLIHQHSGFPELYEPILELIKDQNQPSAEDVKFLLNKSQWMAQVSGSVVAMETNSVSTSTMVSSVRMEKLEAGKTGLGNLGNTCYMNSVLQALYMCDQFRHGILEKAPTGGENLLVKLQHTFARLSWSYRPFIEPRTFLLASRPPWFMPGHQQDCSEFLKYLLDQLHENEVSHGKRILRNLSSSSSLSGGNIHNGKPSKKGEVTLTAVKPRSEEEMCGFDLESQDMDSSSMQATYSLVEKIFRGKVQTTMRCIACGQKSKRVESFSDIPLAFPNSNTSSQELPQKSLAGGSAVPSTTMSGNPLENTPSHNDDILFDSVFSLNDLISFYLKPEKLTGENQYHCDSCGKLQDGERRIHIVESPQYLILTLLRFSYDTKLQSRTKIFQDVKYPRTLSLPVLDTSPNPLHSNSPKEDFVMNSYSNNNTNSCNRNKIVKQETGTPSSKLDQLIDNISSPRSTVGHPGMHPDLYGLCAVVVHSGVSSESGHYYCYARHSQAGQVDTAALDTAKDDTSDVDLLPDKWYNFNDSRVAHANFNSFSNVMKKFSKDTAYVLIYRKLDIGKQEATSQFDPTLHSNLRDAVTKDNEKFLMEQELEAQLREAQQRRSSSITSTPLHNWRDDSADNDQPGGPPGRGGGSFGGGLDTTGSKFVF